MRVVCLRSPDRLQGDALTNFRILEKLDVPVVVWDEGKDFSSSMAMRLREAMRSLTLILGTGLKSEVQGLYRPIIEALEYAYGACACGGCPVGA